MDYTVAQIASVVVPTFMAGLAVGWVARLILAAITSSPTGNKQK
jgi:hypothetical protein